MLLECKYKRCKSLLWGKCYGIAFWTLLFPFWKAVSFHFFEFTMVLYEEPLHFQVLLSVYLWQTVNICKSQLALGQCQVATPPLGNYWQMTSWMSSSGVKNIQCSEQMLIPSIPQCPIHLCPCLCLLHFLISNLHLISTSVCIERSERHLPVMQYLIHIRIINPVLCISQCLALNKHLGCLLFGC